MLTSVEGLLCEGKGYNNLERAVRITYDEWDEWKKNNLCWDDKRYPNWYKNYPNSCYYLSMEKKNWYGARQYCRSYGADLVTPNTEELDVTINDFINLHGIDDCGIECQVCTIRTHPDSYTRMLNNRYRGHFKSLLPFEFLALTGSHSGKANVHSFVYPSVYLVQTCLELSIFMQASCSLIAVS